MDELNLENMSPLDMLEYRLREISRPADGTQYSRPKIQKVENNLREREDFRSHYLPKVVSMGPIYHGEPELQIGERYKLIWAKKYIEQAGESKLLYKNIADNIDELKSCFADNVLAMACNTDLKGFGNLDEKLTWMLFVDGCSLLYILDIDNDFKTGEMIMKLVIRDVLLLENQLPFMLLRLLSSDMRDLIERVKLFLDFKHVASTVNQENYLPHMETSTHLLDLLRKTFFFEIDYDEVDQIKIQTNYVNHVRFIANRRNNSVVQNVAGNLKRRSNSVVRYMNIQELKSNGINIKSSKTCKLLDINFSHGLLNGELTLPEIVLDDIRVTTFLNLIAYEMCPDFENEYEIGTYLSFINSLIRQPEDVKDLRSAGILISNYGSDEELVKLFRFMTTDVVFNEEIYSLVFYQINKHIANKWKTYAVRILRHIRHQWTNFAIHATELALVLTFIQTWFTVHPVKS